MSDLGSNKFARAIGERIREVRGQATRAEAVDGLGVHPNTLAKYEEGKRVPDAEFIDRFCKKFAVKEHWLLTGDGSMRGDGLRLSFDGPGALPRVTRSEMREVPRSYRASKQPSPSRDFDDYIFIPIWDGRASSGHGSYETGDELSGALAFTKSWIDSTVRGPIERLIVILNKGHSNEPDINDGDAMLVDRSVERIQDDAYYVFDEGGVLLVKMIERKVGGGIMLKSRNPEYEPRSLSSEEAAGVTVFGRVRWRGGAV